VNIVHYAHGVHHCQCRSPTFLEEISVPVQTPSAAAGAVGSRRSRQRDATTAEIKATARRLLVDEGPDALTLRAIARGMGMTAPALYRYFGSHEELVGAVCFDLLDEITRTLEQARDSVGPDDPLGRLMAACRAFRGWSLGHPREFHLVFASAGSAPPAGHEMVGADLSFGAVFLGIFVEIWAAAPFATPPEEVLPEGLVAQLAAFSAYVQHVLPMGALAAYLSGWVRLYGAVTIEVFGHLGFALTDAEPMFEAMLAEMRRQLTTPPAAG
jgi:AcrR family transcriptional regulator